MTRWHQIAYLYKFNGHDHKGIITKNKDVYNNFISVSGSPESSASQGYDRIINDDRIAWQSTNLPESYALLSFNTHMIQLQSLSLWSCTLNNCAKSFNVYGSNQEQCDFICSINETYQTFKKRKENVPCETNYSYNNFKIVQTDINSDGGDYFTITYLDLFGFLVNNHYSVVSNCRRINSFIFHKLLCILLIKSN